MSKPNYTGIYHMVSQNNFEEYLAALGKLQHFFLIYIFNFLSIFFFSQFCNLRAYDKWAALVA